MPRVLIELHVVLRRLAAMQKVTIEGEEYVDGAALQAVCADLAGAPTPFGMNVAITESAPRDRIVPLMQNLEESLDVARAAAERETLADPGYFGTAATPPPGPAMCTCGHPMHDGRCTGHRGNDPTDQCLCPEGDLDRGDGPGGDIEEMVELPDIVFYNRSNGRDMHNSAPPVADPGGAGGPITQADLNRLS